VYVDASEAANSNVDEKQDFGCDVGFFRPTGAANLVVACRGIDFVDQLAKDDSDEREWYSSCYSCYTAHQNQYLVEPCRVRIEEKVKKTEEWLNGGPRGHTDSH
jgi:hypothetical protein